jgi:hypothetical protein
MSSADRTKLDGIAAGAQTGTVTSIATNNGVTGGTITTTGTIGLTGQALALHNLGTNGLITRTAAGTIAAREIAAGTRISITNGNGVNGNPTITADATDLGTSANTTTRTVTSSTGTNVVLPTANSTLAGVMSSADRTKLDGIAAGAQVNVATNLSVTGTGNTRTITSSTGSNVTIPIATTSLAGWMSTGDKSKLDGIAAGAQVNVATNLTYSTATTTGTVNSSTGTNATIPAATTSLAGLMTNADKTKLNGIAAGAQVNVATNLGTSASTTTRTVTSSTGSDVVLPAVTTSLAGVMTAADKSKLNGIAAGAQVNVATNLSWTNGTTAGPRVNSSTGANAVMPTASASISGAVTTGAQTWAGNKTFNNSVRAASLGVGTNASGTTGEIRATNNITAFFSDDRLKDRGSNINNALEKLCSLDGFYYTPNDTAAKLGYEKIPDVGVSAQQVKEILPEIVVPAPIDEKYMTVRYEKFVPLLIEAIKEQQTHIQKLEKRIVGLEKSTDVS